MKGFWAWLVSAWKSPTSEVESSKLNGYLSLGLTVFFAAIVVNYNFYNIILFIMYCRYIQSLLKFFKCFLDFHFYFFVILFF